MLRRLWIEIMVKWSLETREALTFQKHISYNENAPCLVLKRRLFLTRMHTLYIRCNRNTSHILNCHLRDASGNDRSIYQTFNHFFPRSDHLRSWLKRKPTGKLWTLENVQWKNLLCNFHLHVQPVNILLLWESVRKKIVRH